MSYVGSIRFPFTCHEMFSGWSPSASHRIETRSFRRTETCFWWIRTVGPTAEKKKVHFFFSCNQALCRYFQTYRAPLAESICSSRLQFRSWPDTKSILREPGSPFVCKAFHLHTLQCRRLWRSSNLGTRPMAHLCIRTMPWMGK